MMRLILYLAFLATATPAVAASYVAGTWYGQGQPFDKSAMWLERFSADGEFHGLYRQCVKGKAQDSSQAGWWSLDGDIETLKISTTNGVFNPRTDIYKTLAHDAQTWSYRYQADGYVYNARRVDDKFQMPSCETIS
jgi:hypothetical protein